MDIPRHFTAITHIVYNDKALLLFHKKYKIWVPVGGHIERDELPHEAALREIKEESGLDVDLYQHDKDIKMNVDNAKIIVPPVHTVLVDMNPNHQHIDLVFYAKSKNANFVPSPNEAKEMKWLSADEIKSANNMPDNVKILALEAIELLA